MRNATRATMIAVTLSGAVGTPAHADDRRQLLLEAGTELGSFYSRMEEMTEGYSSKKPRPPDECEAAIKAWRARGVKDDELIESGSFSGHPKVQNFRIPLSEMTAICADYRPVYEAGQEDREELSAPEGRGAQPPRVEVIR